MTEGASTEFEQLGEPHPQQPQQARTRGAPAQQGRLRVGAVLTALGLLVWLLSGLQSHREPRSYADGGQPPRYVAVTAGHGYSIAVPGGAKVPEGTVIDPNGLHCTVAGRGEGPTTLSVTVETNTKAVNQIARFTAPVSGDVHIDCAGFAAVYVDDANGSFDLAGLLVLLAIIALAVGVPLLLSGIAAVLKRPHGDRAVMESDEARRGAAIDNPDQVGKSRPLSG